MSTESIWQTFGATTSFPDLRKDMEADVVIIGGGITGVTAAQRLSVDGLKVALLEAHKIGISNTGHSTGNLYETMGKELVLIRKKYSKQVVNDVVTSRREAIGLIEKNIEKYGIDCDYRKVPWVYYSAIPEMVTYIEKNFRILKDVKIPVDYKEIDHPSIKSVKAIQLEGQAQFNPLRYVQGLAKAIHNDACQIFENSNVLEVTDMEDGSCIVRTEEGSVKAKFVIHATHTPKGIMFYHNLLEPYREYGIACKIRDPQHPPGIYFGHYDSNSIVSTRTYEINGQHYLIVVGSPHKVAHGDSNHHMKSLEEFAARHFEVVEFTHRWGGQHYKPADELPYIGKKAGNSKAFVATGFSTHGLAYGTLAAMIISDEIMGRKNAYADLYSATRFTPVKSAKNFVKENATVFYDFVKDYLKNDKSPFDDVALGEGKVVNHDGHKLAVYRDENLGLQVCSAICTHMACVVRWNSEEKSWDCPCHGSRFDTNGEVLEGPALTALAKANLIDDETPVTNPIQIFKEGFETGLGT